MAYYNSYDNSGDSSGYGEPDEENSVVYGTPTIEQLKSADNICELLDPNKINQIGQTVISGYRLDEESMSEWKYNVDCAMDIAKQTISAKNDPWPNASNVKFPLISEACIDYASRTFPEIIPNNRVVKCGTAGMDPDGAKQRRADRVSRFVSHQLMIQNKDWEDQMDTLVSVLPVVGTVFTKTYYDDFEGKVCSDFCPPDKVVVNYATPSLSSARRITHILDMSQNDVIERQRQGLFTEMDIELLNDSYGANMDEDPMLCILEQHCWYDLDEDGYKEPYIVTVHKESGCVLRIVNRFDEIRKSKKGVVYKITAEEYFTDYHFIKSPDGGFYSIGFGILLLPINSSINTIINLLVDSGTLANTQGGFLGRGLRLKNGEIKIKMSQWRVVDAAPGSKIADNVVPLPVREPSNTLLSLLSLLIQIGKDLTASTDMLKGKQPAQNVSNGVANQLIEQGTVIFRAINKRLYRGLKEQFNKVFLLDNKYLSQKMYMDVLDDPEADVKADFELKSMDIFPVADPNLSSDTQRFQRAQVAQQLRTVDVRQADTYMLESLQFEPTMIEKLLPPIDPNAPPPPEVLEMQAKIRKIDADIAEISANATLAAEENQMKMVKMGQELKESEARINEAAARVWKMQEDANNNRNKLDIVAAKMTSQETIRGADFARKQQKDASDAVIKDTDTRIKAAKAQTDAVKVATDAALKDKELELTRRELENDREETAKRMEDTDGE